MWLRQILLFVLVTIMLNAVANTIRVPSEAPTIQAGLDRLENGDTLLVSLGIYAEALTAPPLSFTLKGDVLPDTGDYARPVIDPSSLQGSNSLACLILPAGSHPILEDIAFRNGPEMYPRQTGTGGIRSQAIDPILRRVVMDSVYCGFFDRLNSLAVITLESCHFRHTFGLCISALQSAVHARDCEFIQDYGSSGIQANSHSRILRCQFSGVVPHAENFSLDYMVVAMGTDNRIENCLFGPGWYPHGGSCPLSLYLARNSQVINNTFVNCLENYEVIEVYSDTANAVVISGNNISHCQSSFGAVFIIWYRNIPFGNSFAATIVNNRFTACSGDGSAWSHLYGKAIGLYAKSDVEGNRFFEMTHFPAQPAQPAIQLDTFAIRSVLYENLFYHTDMALRNQVSSVVQADFNWWGDSTGPYHQTLNPGGLGDTIVGNVNFTPWYADSLLSDDVHDPHLPLPQETKIEIYPNPFNSTAKIKLQVKEPIIVKVELFDLLGRKVKELYNAPVAYEKEISFQADNLASGVYFVRVTDTIWNRPLVASKLLLMK